MKPVRIWSRVGRGPLLVLHDDPERECAYTAGAEQALERAKAPGGDGGQHRHDWATVF